MKALVIGSGRVGSAVAKGLADYGFAAANLRAIERDNALELFPRLKR